MRISLRDVFSPANLLTIIGLLLVIAGSLQLTTWRGFALLVIGRILDMLDGPVARRTHTSRFGALVDGAADKIAVLAITIALWAFSLAPTAIVVFILAQNIIVASIIVIASLRGIHAETSHAGKRNMFLQNVAMLLFVAASLSTNLIHNVLLALAYSAFLGVVVYAFFATRGYAQLLRHTTTQST